jgi:hypothetical protein
VGTFSVTSENQSIKKICHHPKTSDIDDLSGNVPVFREQKFILSTDSRIEEECFQRIHKTFHAELI